jgi:hypothetical protein
MIRTRRLLESALQVEIKSISRMGSASLREAVSALTQSESFTPEQRVDVMNAVCQRAITIKTDMRYWDLVALVQAYAWSVPQSAYQIESLEEISKIIGSKLSHLSVKHLLDLLMAYKRLGMRPAVVHTSLLDRVSDAVKGTMYADELVALTLIMARTGMEKDSRKFVTTVAKSIVLNDSLLNQMRFLHSCEVAGALASMTCLESRLEEKLMRKCQFELEVMPLEELWKTITGFEKLAFSYTPFEELASDRLTTAIVPSLEASSFDQVTRPIDFFNFLRIRDLVTDDLLVVTCKWANDAVYRPATRTQAFRRPTIFEVAFLADLCRERGIETSRIEKAIRITVTSKGGTEQTVAKPKPLRYRKRRAYLKEPDGYAAMKVVPVKAIPEEQLSAERKNNEAAFAPKLRAGGVQLWKVRSGPWFSRK